MASALDDLLSDFGQNAGTMPAVNPPESAKVLAAQTQPEVAGEPEPPEQKDAPPAPTEKPAEVRAEEAAKTRKPRGASKPAALPAAEPAAPKAESRLADPATAEPSTDQLVAALQGRGYDVQLIARRT